MLSLFKVQILFFFVCLWSYQTNGQSASFQKLLLLKLTSRMPRNAANFVRNHCELNLTSSVQRCSVETWKNAVMKCRNLQDNIIPTVICNSKCVDPISRQTMPRLKAVTVTYLKTVTSREGRAIRLDIPFACKCVARSSRNAANCPRNPTTGKKK